MDRAAVIEALCGENEEFKRIRDKHQAYEKELEEYSQRHYFSSNEELAIKEIKKNKLLLKDKMEKFIVDYVKNN
jgi:uncharacterized protein YdcH (DUF465 family)